MSANPTYVFKAPPAVGELHYFYGQPYRVDAVAPYTRTDGTASAIITWRTVCPTCGATVLFKGGLSGRIDRRRCVTCIQLRRAKAIRSGRFRPAEWQARLKKGN